MGEYQPNANARMGGSTILGWSYYGNRCITYLFGKILGRCSLTRRKEVHPALLLHQDAARDRAANALADGVLRHVRADGEDLLEKYGLVRTEAFEQIFRKGFQLS